ncbi:MAG TPA: hypothetical protein VFV23_07725 [Verrucomicrobiae bacterium]|nr:hypothetical protein [Verrucomicrobiae bacterium]
MKQYFSTMLILICLALVAVIVSVKHIDNAQHQGDVSAFTDCSNQLVSAQGEILVCDARIFSLSNDLAEIQSSSAICSNQLAEARSAADRDTKQLAELNQQLLNVKSENEMLGKNVATLTNQMADLVGRLATTTTNLEQANRDYALLENRLRRDIAERLVTERKFNNAQELQAQLENVRKNPSRHGVSSESIYADLDIEVESNRIHVISPD